MDIAVELRLLYEALAWPSMVVQGLTAIWLVLMSVGLRVLVYKGMERREQQQHHQSGGRRVVGGEKCSRVMVTSSLAMSDVVTIHNRKSKRVVVVAASPAVASPLRSMDVPRVPFAATMRVQSVQQLPPRPTPQSRTINAPAPLVPTCVSTNGLQQREQQPIYVRREERVIQRASAPPFWRVSAYTAALLVSMIIVLSNVAIASADTVADSLPRLQSEWYIVLVSIPVLDKVLPLKNLAEELLHRGYRVGFALPENCRHWVSDLERLEFISLGSMLGKTRSMPYDVDDLSSMGVYESYAATLRYYASFQRPMFDALMEDLEEDRPDLMVVDRYTFAGVDASHALKIPYVINSPTLLLDMDSPPAYIPAPFSNFTLLNPRVLDRCLNSFYRLRFRLVMVQLFKDVNQVRQDRALPPIETKDDLFGQELVLVNSVFGLDDARPITPQFQMVGMMGKPTLSHKQTPTLVATLPGAFERWLANDLTGKPIVLISFHSDFPLSPHMVTMLMDGLESIGARLVWKVALQEKTALDLRSRSRSSVFFLSDAVQESLVLDRVPVALLITAGDTNSVYHALSLGVPILGIPLQAEQWEVMNAIVRTGAGLSLQTTQLTPVHVRTLAEQLLHKPSFSSAAFHVGEMLQTGGGTRRAADHIETVLEFGASHAIAAKNIQPLYKTYLVDVYLVYSAILCGAAVILRTCFSVLYSIIQIAPDVHLGVTLDGPDEGVANGADEGHHHHHHGHADQVHNHTGTHHHHHHHRKDKTV